MKTKLGAENCLYPMPIVLVGALVGQKPNYVTVSHVGIMDHRSISLSIGKGHYTNAGIRKTKTFSVNLPSLKLVREADYCGLVSGKEMDKAELFATFYGELRTAPMIEECPLNMEVRLVRILDFPQHEIFIGEIIQTYCDEKCLTHGLVDFSKIRPILFTMNDRGYWKLGRRFQNAWQAGKKVRTQRRNGH